MRIIAGQYRGKKLFTPDGKNVRPTSERAREAVFNILNSHPDCDYDSIRLADIFAGTGAFGLEAISRGAAMVTLVDKDTTLAAKNAKMFIKEQSKIKIIKTDALNFCGRLSVRRKQSAAVFGFFWIYKFAANHKSFSTDIADNSDFFFKRIHSGSNHISFAHDF